MNSEERTMSRDQIALFRYGVIFPLLDERLEYGEKTKLEKELSEKEYEIPFSGKRSICRATIRRWQKLFRKGGIDALYPKDRSDKGVPRALDKETLVTVAEMKKEHPEWPVTTIISKVREESGGDIPIYPVYRALRDTAQASGPGENMRRFEMECCNDCWMLDAMHGPKVLDEGRVLRKAYCFGFIDDKSRIIPHAEFYFSESADSLMDCMWKAFNKRGLPRMIYTDNGSAMKDLRLKLGLADLEVQLTYSTAYRPQGKAKIERFWRTLRMQFLPTLPPEGTYSLAELNRRLAKFVDEYNRRFHSGIGTSPMERYMGEVLAVRPAPSDMPKHFRNRVERTVSAARTVSLERRIFEVPLGYKGKRLELRYFTLDEVEAFFNGKSLGLIHEVNLTGNSVTSRNGKEDA